LPTAGSAYAHTVYVTNDVMVTYVTRYTLETDLAKTAFKLFWTLF